MNELKKQIPELRVKLVDKEMELYGHHHKIFRPAQVRRGQLQKEVDDLKRNLFNALEEWKK